MHPLNVSKKSVATAFNKASNTYDDAASLQKSIGYILLDQLIPTLSPSVVLDIGCGTGYLTQALLKKYPNTQIYNIDLAEKMLHGQLYSKAILADFDRLPFADQSVDILIANLCAQWSPSLSATIAEWFRVLKTGGRILFSTMIENSMYELRKSWQQVMDISLKPDFLTAVNVHNIFRQQKFHLQQTHQLQPTLYFDSLAAILRLFKSTGVNPELSRSHGGLMGKNKWQAIEKQYHCLQKPWGLPVTYHILWLEAIR